ncbi:MAG: DNA starvation/stationary phase protection protein [Chloroflexota bacterium]
MAKERKKTIQSLLPMRNGMTEDARKHVIGLLNQQTADHYVILTKTKFYHWNVEGPEFHDIHELLDEHYEILADIVDEIAEQALKLGGQAAGTLAWFKSHSRLSEDEDEKIPDTRRMIENLVNDHESIMEFLHADIKTTDEKDDDAVTSNMLQDISAKHHKMAWMLRMILQVSSLESA